MTNYVFDKAGTDFRVLNTAFESAAAVNYDPELGLIWFEAFGTVNGAVDPFLGIQNIDIDLIQVTFTALGKNRALAVCEYKPPSGGGVRFVSDPVGS